MAHRVTKRKLKRKSVCLFLLFVLIISILVTIISSLFIRNASIDEAVDAFVLPYISTTTKTDDTPSTAIRQQRNPGKEPIRRWGCHRKETPLIYVHIGKSGGGSVRARFAAAALNYTRGGRIGWANPNLDNHYYPISKNTKGKFCNSKNNNYHVINSSLYPKTFEGNVPCNASTPIGMAVACPGKIRDRCLGCNAVSRNCRTVYAGHNAMGSELHWLPPKFLQQWWSKNWEHPKSTHSFAVKKALNTLNPSTKRWCFGQAERPGPDDRGEKQNKLYHKCGLPLASLVDGQFRKYWQQLQKATDREVSFDLANNNFSPIYASLPVHRVTVLRDPYSWLVSIFFWNKYYNMNMKCDDIERASRPNKSGWAHYHILKEYILKLCGVDCSIRYENGLTSLDELEAQTESNLRRSFSVVGLLNETDHFYEMVSKRISYVDMALNPHVTGNKHTSFKKDQKAEIERCSKIFGNKDFQERFKKELPVLATIERLYNVAVEVNRFQQKELQKCNIQ